MILMMALVKELQDRLIAFRDDEDKVTRAGWVSQGTTQMDPAWHYSVWNPKEKNPPVSTSTLLSSLEVLFQNVAAPGVLQRFRGPVLDSWQTLRRLPLRLSAACPCPICASVVMFLRPSLVHKIGQ